MPQHAQAAYIRDHAGQSPVEVPSPEPGAQLSPDIVKYLDGCQLQVALEDIVGELINQHPDDPAAFLADRLDAKQVG